MTQTQALILKQSNQQQRRTAWHIAKSKHKENTPEFDKCYYDELLMQIENKFVIPTDDDAQPNQ